MKGRWLWPLFILGLLVGCARESSILPRYKAEKAFFKAGKLYQRILINPNLAQKEDYSRTIEAYRKVIGFQDQDKGRGLEDLTTKARLKIAQLYLAQGEYQQTIDEYQKLLNDTKQDKDLQAFVRLSLAQTYEGMGDLHKAIEEYRTLAESYLSSPPQNKLAQELLPTPLQIPRLYRRLGKGAANEYSWARELYQGIVNRWPQTPLALLAQNQIAISYADQGKWREAVNALEGIVKKYPQSPLLPQILFAAGDIYSEKLNLTDQALRTYQQILDNYPEDPLGGRAELSIGRLYLKKGLPAQARKAFQEVIKKFPKDVNSSAEAQFGIGASYETEGKWDQALNEYRWVLDKYPHTQAALRIPLYLADHYSQAGIENLAKQEYKRAVKTYQGMVEDSPKSLYAAYAQEKIAQCYLHQKRWREAISSLWSLIRDFPPSRPMINGYLLLGMVYETKLQDKSGALKVYKEFLRRFPNHPLKEKVKKKMEDLK